MKWRAFREMTGREIKPEHKEDYVLRLLKEIRNNMPSIDEVKVAVAQAASDVVTAITDAVTKETAEVVAQIKAIPVGQPITQADLDSIVASVKGIGTAAAGAIDSISVNDNSSATIPVAPVPPIVP